VDLNVLKVMEIEIDELGLITNPTMGFILSHEYIIFMLVSAFIAIGIIQIQVPFLAYRMINYYNSGELVVGFLFFLLNISEFAGSALICNFTDLN